ncbi:hypothetical protein GO730_39145 [Spirosoma sp. HMF3257]|uniref:Uncharacterized protein n=1 Tax=Spirosoma telluris TaxID=2183553 RepID=A0A327NF86_9BACT|nr:hypothetical protein [Spirosoma telluris]RAI72909.1 hypothetical protein HMF3257_39075 [Spirosoma telluris]
MADMYLRKKATEILSNLVLPLNIFRDKKELFTSTIEILRSYSLSNYITIVLPDKVEEGEKGSSSYYYYDSNKIVYETKIQRINFNKLEYISKLYQIEDYKFLPIIYPSNFKSVIIIPIQYGTDKMGIIQIATKRKITQLFNEDLIFYSQVGSKLGNTLHFLAFFTAFWKMPTLLTNKKSSFVYEEINNRAKEIFNSDITILFDYDPDKRYGLSKAYILGDLYIKEQQKQSTSELENIDMVHITLQHGAIYIQNQQEYLHYWTPEKRQWKSETYSQDFWQREKIKSFASIKFEINNKTLGCLFLNFRDSEQVLITILKIN